MIKTVSYVYAGIVTICMAFIGLHLLRRLIARGRGNGTLTSGRYRVIPPAGELAVIFAAALLSRIVLFLWAFLLLHLFEGTSGNLAQDFYHLFIHWDARHYYGIASEGYTAVGEARLRLVFFPLYPMLMRLLQPLTGGNLSYSGTLISVLSGSGAAVLLYILACNIRDVDPVECVMLFLLSPLSVFLCCIYTEGLFLLLSLAAYLLRRFGHPWAGAIFGMLAALTRMPGIVLAGFILIDLLESLFARTLTGRSAAAGIAQMLIVFSGLFIYWGINQVVTGDPFMYLTYQRENWYQQAGTFMHSARNTMQYFLESVGEDDRWWTWGTQVIAIVLAMLVMIRARHLPFDLMAFSFVYMVVILSPTWLLSGPRYMFGLFVLPVMQERALARLPGWVHLLVMVLSGGLLLLFVYGFTLAVQVF